MTLPQYFPKFTYGWLPVGSRIHTYRSTYLPHCSSCNPPEEDQEHVFRCPKQKEWLGGLFNELRTYIDTHQSDEHLGDILLDGLKQWFKFGTVLLPTYPNQYTRLILQQTLIVWEQVIYGRVTKEWSSCQDCYLEKRSHSVKFSGKKWITGLLHILQRHARAAWLTRNQVTHGHDSVTREIAKLAQAT